MALKLIQGKIGAGKTYFAVHHVVTNYAEWDDSKDEWRLKEGVAVYSNIESFRIGHDLEEVIKEAGGLNPFFTMEYQREFCRNRQVIYIIDECQGPDFFHSKYYDPFVFLFLQKSRHLGIDIYLITQDIDSVARQIRKLPEFHIVPSSRSKAMSNELRYSYQYDDGERFKTKVLPREKRVFSLYKSCEVFETEKIPSGPRRFLIMFAVMVILAVFSFKFFFLTMFKTTNVEAKTSDKPEKVVLNDYETIKKTEVKINDDVNVSYPAYSSVNSERSKQQKATRITVTEPLKEVYKISSIAVSDGVYIAVDGQGIYDLTEFNKRFKKGAYYADYKLCFDSRCYDVGDTFDI